MWNNIKNRGREIFSKSRELGEREERGREKRKEREREGEEKSEEDAERETASVPRL